MSQEVPPPQLSPDRMYYWNGKAWVSTVPMQPATGAIPSSYEPTSWTRPLQAAVAEFFILEGLFSATLPLWFIGTMTQYANTMNQRLGVPSPSPEDVARLNTINDEATVAFYVVVGFSVVLAIAAIVSAIRRWTWSYPLIIVTLTLEALFFLMTMAQSLVPSLLQPGAPPPLPVLAPAATFLVLAAALSTCMIVAQVRSGPWGMRRSPA